MNKEFTKAKVERALNTKGKEYIPMYKAAAEKHGVPFSILVAQAAAENGFWNPDIISGKRKSSTGAAGIGQFMPATAKQYGINPLDPEQSIDAQAKYLANSYGMHGSWDKALAGYNAGDGAVQKHGGVPPYKETQDYVAKIGSVVGGYSKYQNKAESNTNRPEPVEVEKPLYAKYLPADYTAEQEQTKEQGTAEQPLYAKYLPSVQDAPSKVPNWISEETLAQAEVPDMSALNAAKRGYANSDKSIGDKLYYGLDAAGGAIKDFLVSGGTGVENVAANVISAPNYVAQSAGYDTSGNILDTVSEAVKKRQADVYSQYRNSPVAPVGRFVGEVAPALAVPILRATGAGVVPNAVMNAGVQGAANYAMADDEYRKVAGGLGVTIPLISPIISKAASPIMNKISEMTSAVKSGIGSATGVGMSPGEYLIQNSGVRGAMEDIANAGVSTDVAKYFNKAAGQTLPTGSTPTLNQAIAMANGADTTMNDFVGALASSDRGASIKNVLNNQSAQLKAIAEKGLAGDISGSTYSDVAETVAAPVRGVAALSDELINVADYNKMFKEMPRVSMNSNTPTAMREAYKANAFTTTGDKVVNNSQLQRTMKLIDGMDASKGAVPSKDIQMIRANLNSVISSTQDNQAKATAKAVKDVLDADLMSQNPIFKLTNDVYRTGKQGQASDFYHTVASNPDDVKLAQALIQPNKSQQILNYDSLMQTLKGKEIDELSKDAVNAIPRMKAAEVRERMFKNGALRPSAIAEIDKRGLLKGVNGSAAKAFKDTADIINKGRKTGEVGSKTANVQALIKSVSGELSPTMLAGTLGIDMLGGSGVATAGLALSRVKGFMTKRLVDKLVEASVDPKLAAKYVDEYLAKHVEKEAGVIVKTAKAIAETMKNTPLPYAATINTMNANDQETR